MDVQRKRRYRRELVMRVGKWLLTEKKTVKIKDVSQMLGVSRRTLGNWKKQVQREELKTGRPSYNEAEKIRAILQVGREWKRQGSTVGWRGVEAGLDKKIPTRLVQKTLSRLKLLQRKKYRMRLEKERISVKVKYRNIYWSQDGAKYKKENYQIIKDRSSLKVLSAKKLKVEKSKIIIDLLKKMKETRGLPLVLGTDNGSMYTSQETQTFLAENQIVHLRSLPRTPQHNGSVECAIRELKEEAMLNDCSLDEAASRLNKNRLRASFSFKSSEKIDDKVVCEYSEKVRSFFYYSCQAEIQKCCSEIKNNRSKRMMERKVILKNLEQFGFIKINRGGLN